jgi:hypothetical protein
VSSLKQVVAAAMMPDECGVSLVCREQKEVEGLHRPKSAQFIPKLCPDVGQCLLNQTQVNITDFLSREFHE